MATQRSRRSALILGLVFGCVAVCLVILVAAFMRSGGPHRNGALPPESRAVESGEPTGNERPDAPRSAVSPATEPGAFDDSSSTPRSVSASVEARETFSPGRLVMLDEQDRELSGLDGSLKLRFLASGSLDFVQEEFDVRVQDGRFRFELPDMKGRRDGGLAITIESLLVDNRAGYGTLERFPVQPPDEVVLVGRWYRKTTLQVFDARTRGELSEVQVLRRPGLTVDHPGVFPHDKPVVETMGAPLILDPPLDDGLFDGVEGIWLRSEQSRWQRVFVDHRSGGEGRVFLDPGSDLVIELAGELPPRYRVEVSALEDWTPDGTVPHDAVLAVAESQETARLRLCGLPLGPVGVWVEEDSPGHELERLVGRATTEVRAAGVNTATVIVAREEHAGARLSGTLMIDPALTFHARSSGLSESSLLGLSIHGDDPPRFFRHVPPEEFLPVQGRPGLWSWDAGVVPLGLHRVAHKLDVECEVELGLDGRQDVHVVIPDFAAEVEVCFVDERTGEELRGGLLAWEGSPFRGQRISGLSYWWDDECRAFRLFTVPGALQLDLNHHTHYLPESSRALSVPAGESRHTIVARPMCALVLRTRSRGLPVPPPAELTSAEFHAEEGAGEVVLVKSLDTEVTYYVSAPGTYELRFPELDGILTPEGIRVEIVEGFSDRFIDLVSER